MDQAVLLTTSPVAGAASVFGGVLGGVLGSLGASLAPRSPSSDRWTSGLLAWTCCDAVVVPPTPETLISDLSGSFASRGSSARGKNHPLKRQVSQCGQLVGIWQDLNLTRLTDQASHQRKTRAGVIRWHQALDPSVGSNRLEPSFCRRRIEFCDLRLALCQCGVWAGDECSADLGAVPARLHAEAKRLVGLHVTCREDNHNDLSMVVACTCALV